MGQSDNNRERWRAMENEYAKTAAERFVDNVPRRENPQQVPGVKLDDDEVANITLIRKKKGYPKLL